MLSARRFFIVKLRSSFLFPPQRRDHDEKESIFARRPLPGAGLRAVPVQLPFGPALRPRTVDGVDVRTGPNSVTGAFYTHQLTCYVFSCRPDDGYVTVSSGAYGDAAAKLPLEYFSPTTLSGVEFFPEDLRYGDKLLVSCALDDAQADVLSLRLLPGGITLDDTDRAS